MLRFHPSRFIWVLALMLGMGMVGSQAQEYRYQYVSLNAAVPQPYLPYFEPSKVTNNGRVYGTVYDSNFQSRVAFYKNGIVTVLQAGQTLTANEGGTIGGRVYVDNNGTTVIRAALFYDKKVELVPPLSDHELDSYISKLTDSGIALVVSTNSYDGPPTVKNWSYALYQNGRLTKLDFSEKNGDKNLVLPWFLDINNQGLISGKKKTEGQEIERAFVFNPRTVEMTTLDPLWEVGDIYSWALSINNGEKVLGYSFNAFGIPARIGVWSSQGKFKTFKTYFDENQAGFVSNYLLFNDNNLIIITDTSDGKSYLVPTPYVLLDLTNLVNNGSLGSYTSVVSVNNQGDMAGYAWDTGDTFLLKRIGPGKPPK